MSLTMHVNRELSAQLVKYLGASFSGTALHYLLLASLVHGAGVRPVPASTCGAMAGAMMIYGLNYFITFRSTKAHGPTMARFLLVAGLGLIIKRKRAWPLMSCCVATLPAALLGVTLGKYAESILRSPVLVIFTLSGAGAILWWAEKIGRRERGLESIGGRDAMIIGCAQAIALIPGVSRSGATMSAGLLLGLDRTAAARFSFLLSAPILLGAGGYKILELFRGPGLADGQISFFLVGFLAATISGYGFIGFLMKFVQTQSLAVFAYYRFCLSTVVAMAIFFGGY